MFANGLGSGTAVGDVFVNMTCLNLTRRFELSEMPAPGSILTSETHHFLVCLFKLLYDRCAEVKVFE